MLEREAEGVWCGPLIPFLYFFSSEAYAIVPGSSSPSRARDVTHYIGLTNVVSSFRHVVGIGSSPQPPETTWRDFDVEEDGSNSANFSMERRIVCVAVMILL